MKEKFKRVLKNSLIVFIICFLIIFIFQTYQDYEYYSVYSKEDLAEVLSIKKTLLWNLSQAFSGSILQLIIFVPILTILEKFNKKNIFKILIAILLTIIISFILLITHMTIDF